MSLLDFSKRIEDFGVGEIVLNSIDRDGTLKGYDFNLIDEIYNYLNIPFTIIGGASNNKDFKDVVKKYHHCGVGASSVFIFKGKHKAVLIQYPTLEEKNGILYP